MTSLLRWALEERLNNPLLPFSGLARRKMRGLGSATAICIGGCTPGWIAVAYSTQVKDWANRGIPIMTNKKRA